jgi:alpha-D-xyloside xylohydrolase
VHLCPIGGNSFPARVVHADEIMKFSRGAWLWEEGVSPGFVRRISDYRVQDDALLIDAVDRDGSEGMDRVEGRVLQLRITSPLADVIRVQVRHHHPKTVGVTEFDLDYGLKAPKVVIDEEQDDLVFSSGKLSLRLSKAGPWQMRFEEGGRPLTGGGRDTLGNMHVDGAAGGRGDFLMQRLSLAVGECIYGMGERFGPLVKNGQSVAIWNEDGGTCSELAYKNLPFYLSSRGYGLLVNSPGKVEFEVATERVSQMQISVPGEALDYYVFYGPDLKDVIGKYTRLAGRPAVPPAWSFGLWLSTSFTTHYNERTVNEFVDGMIERGIPLKVFHFDCFWMKERHWCDFEWDREAFPHPREMIERLRAKGLKICLWINPYISQLSSAFAEGRDRGYFLKRADGSVYQRDQWQPGMAFVDFTNPAACEWYQGKLAALLEMGVDSFKTDFGERIPEDAVYHDGSDPLLMHNYYPYLYNKTVFDLLERYHGKGNALVFARSATVGCQKFPVQWGGDCETTFESMAEDLRGGLSFCLSGPAFWSHDIGGFTGEVSPALYKRWVAFGLLSTHSRLHGSESYRVPWLFDEESVSVLRHFTRLKNRLFPYLFSAAHDAAAHGWPVMRAMVLEYPQDPACRYLDRQYMLGSSLLVAPVFREDGVAEYYLPKGRWTHLITGEEVDGGQWRKDLLDFQQLPLFVRENSVIAMSDDEEQTQWRLSDPLTLNLFDIADGADLLLCIPSSDGDGAAMFNCRRDGEKISLSGDGHARCVRVLMRSCHAAREILNGKIAGGKIAGGKLLHETPAGLLIDWPHTNKPLSLVLADREGDAPMRERRTVLR